MKTLPRFLPDVKPTDLDSDPATWPEWTDLDRWVPTDPGPDPDDLAWASQVFNADEDLDESRAAESAALDAIERYLIPQDLAEGLARGSIVGLADRILHSGSQPSQCGCYQCVDARTARYAE